MQFELIIILLTINIVLTIVTIYKKINITVVVKNDKDQISTQQVGSDQMLGLPASKDFNVDRKIPNEPDISALIRSAPKASGFGKYEQ